jgi:hypothetical protein
MLHARRASLDGPHQPCGVHLVDGVWFSAAGWDRVGFSPARGLRLLLCCCEECHVVGLVLAHEPSLHERRHAARAQGLLVTWIVVPSRAGVG